MVARGTDTAVGQLEQAVEQHRDLETPFLHGIFKRAARVWGLDRNPAGADLVEHPPARYSGEFRTLRPDEVLLLVQNAHNPQGAAI